MGKIKKNDTNKQVEDILKGIKKTVGEEKPVSGEKQDDVAVPQVRGRPKSGRIWKTQKTRFKTVVKTRGLRQTFAEKEELRQKMKAVREASKSIKEQKLAEKEAKKERRRINLKKAEENRLKSEIVQVITNSSKIKRMKKKQLRFIQKRDTSNITK